MTIGDFLTMLMGGGFVATLGAGFRGLRSLQTGARARERDTVNSLVTQRNEAWHDRDQANDQRDYWRNWAGTLEYTLRQAGVPIPDKPNQPGETS